MTRITENIIEDFAIELLDKLGYEYIYAPDIAYDGENPERDSYMLVSFTPGYASSHRIRHTIANIVLALAQHGHFVIAGRGGVGVLRNLPNTLHVRLQAPVEWRIPEICKLRGVTEREALKLAEETDAKRTALIELMYGQKFHPGLFDLHFNCSTLGKDEIVQTIIGLMKVKKLI